MKQGKNGTLLKRFAPYYKKYWTVLVFDLFCASLTTICEIVLPLIFRYITNEGMRNLAGITSRTVLHIACFYFGLRIIDGLANFYMAYSGHVMGAKIETDMREDAFTHLQKLSDRYYSNTKVGQLMSLVMLMAAKQSVSARSVRSRFFSNVQKYDIRKPFVFCGNTNTVT